MRELTRSPELRVGEDHDLMNGTAREASLRKEQLSRVPEEVGNTPHCGLLPVLSRQKKSLKMPGGYGSLVDSQWPHVAGVEQARRSREKNSLSKTSMNHVESAERSREAQ